VYKIKSSLNTAELQKFIQEIPYDRIAEELMLHCDMSFTEAINFLKLYVNEMPVTLNLIRDIIDPRMQILEVGAGLCLFSIFLKSQGYAVTALEPSIGGFSRFSIAKEVILKSYKELNLPLLSYPVGRLKSCNTKFNFIFSNNVLEHIPNLPEAWVAMVSSLSSGGVMAHNCPNYFVPYEPHFGIPIIKWAPVLNKLIYKSAIAQQKELWDSLNFITYYDVKKLARLTKMEVTFRDKLLLASFNRLHNDPSFLMRHSGGFLVRLDKILRKFGLIQLLRFIPPALSTPMIFICKKTD
jgi:2-polyprenyl-3-methyl-5-hydroxy-6-metoxy-1,4-benzoquinol methylase